MKMAENKNVSFSDHASPRDKDGDEGQKLKILFLRIGVFFLLAGLASGLGAASYIILHGLQVSTFESEFKSSASQVVESFNSGLNAKNTAANMVGKIFAYSVEYYDVGTMPNVTFRGFEDIMDDVLQLATLRAISYCPLVTPYTRAGFEKYANNSVELLGGPMPALEKIVSRGILNKTATVFVKDKNFIPGSSFPTWLFPIWQTAPISQGYVTIMTDMHSYLGTRKETIDNVLLTNRSALSDIVTLLPDVLNGVVRPSSILFSPIRSVAGDRPVIAMFMGIFAWEELLAASLPSYVKEIYCVVSDGIVTYTLTLDQGKVTSKMKSDNHDLSFNSYAVDITSQLDLLMNLTSSNYQITLYPSQSLYNNYVSSLPVTVCAILIAIIVFTMLVIVVYDRLVKLRETGLISAVATAQLTATSLRKLLPKGMDFDPSDLLDTLDNLPIHRAIIQGASTETILAAIKEDPETAKVAVRGRTAFDFALENHFEEIDVTIFTELLFLALPFDPHSKAPVSTDAHGYSWSKAVQFDRLAPSIESVLLRYPKISLELAYTEDREKRRAVNIASPSCKLIILKFMYFFKRYELLTLTQPYHQSETCIVHLAVDHDDRGTKVALKFMRHREQFSREIRNRCSGGFHDEYVVGLLRCHDSEEDQEYCDEVRIKGFAKFPYCIVMEAGERSLGDVLAKENIAGKNWDQLRMLFIQVARAVGHMHERGFTHGDLKPLNIMRFAGAMKLIDLDASTKHSSDEEYSASKYSSGYLPPELIYCVGDLVCVRSIADRSNLVEQGIDRNVSGKSNRSWTTEDTEKEYHDQDQVEIDTEESVGDLLLQDSEFFLVKAHPAQDIWALGVVLFFLCAKCPLFHSDCEGNIVDKRDMRDLCEWTDEFKFSKLSLIKHKLARNLLSLMLVKDPVRRPSIPMIMTHPFVTGKNPTRSAGENAVFDVFLSYRVHSDAAIAELVYDALIDAGLKVWWDKKCLAPGEPWEDGFCKGLATSAMFVPIISRGAINHADNPRQSFAALTSTSPCDNMLLEYRMALELLDRGLIEKVFPIFVGDIDEQSSSSTDTETETGGGKRYLRYTFDSFTGSGCHPTCVGEVVVSSVEEKLRMHLERQGLGFPYNNSHSVSHILSDIVRYHGGFLEGYVLGNTTGATAAASSTGDTDTDSSSSTVMATGTPDCDGSGRSSGRGSGSTLPEIKKRILEASATCSCSSSSKRFPQIAATKEHSSDRGGAAAAGAAATSLV